MQGGGGFGGFAPTSPFSSAAAPTATPSIFGGGNASGTSGTTGVGGSASFAGFSNLGASHTASPSVFGTSVFGANSGVQSNNSAGFGSVSSGMGSGTIIGASVNGSARGMSGGIPGASQGTVFGGSSSLLAGGGGGGTALGGGSIFGGPAVGGSVFGGGAFGSTVRDSTQTSGMFGSALGSNAASPTSTPPGGYKRADAKEVTQSVTTTSADKTEPAKRNDTPSTNVSPSVSAGPTAGKAGTRKPGGAIPASSLGECLIVVRTNRQIVGTNFGAANLKEHFSKFAKTGGVHLLGQFRFESTTLKFGSETDAKQACLHGKKLKPTDPRPAFAITMKRGNKSFVRADPATPSEPAPPPPQQQQQQQQQQQPAKQAQKPLSSRLGSSQAQTPAQPQQQSGNTSSASTLASRLGGAPQQPPPQLQDQTAGEVDSDREALLRDALLKASSSAQPPVPKAAVGINSPDTATKTAGSGAPEPTSINTSSVPAAPKSVFDKPAARDSNSSSSAAAPLSVFSKAVAGVAAASTGPKSAGVRASSAVGESKLGRTPPPPPPAPAPQAVSTAPTAALPTSAVPASSFPPPTPAASPPLSSTSPPPQRTTAAIAPTAPAQSTPSPSVGHGKPLSPTLSPSIAASNGTAMNADGDLHSDTDGMDEGGADHDESDVPLAQRKFIVGTCQDMCPRDEADRRAADGKLVVFEMEPGTENDPLPRVSYSRAVAAYRRAAADKMPVPEEIRPPNVLLRTMEHLTTNVLQHAGTLASPGTADFLVVYAFFRDRFRCMTHDLRVQNVRGRVTVSLLEKIIRFYIMAGHRLCETPADENRFERQQHMEQLSKAFVSLQQQYKDERQAGHIYPSEPEMCGYQLLLKIPTHEVNGYIETLPRDILFSTAVQFGLQIYLCYTFNNYKKFFALVEEASYLTACLMHMFFGEVRKNALDIMIMAYLNKQLPGAEKMIRILGLEDKDDYDALVTAWRDKTAVPPRVSRRVIEPKLHSQTPKMIVDGPLLEPCQGAATAAPAMRVATNVTKKSMVRDMPKDDDERAENALLATQLHAHRERDNAAAAEQQRAKRERDTALDGADARGSRERAVGRPDAAVGRPDVASGAKQTQPSQQKNTGTPAGQSPTITAAPAPVEKSVGSVPAAVYPVLPPQFTTADVGQSVTPPAPKPVSVFHKLAHATPPPPPAEHIFNQAPTQQPTPPTSLSTKQPSSPAAATPFTPAAATPTLPNANNAAANVFGPGQPGQPAYNALLSHAVALPLAGQQHQPSSRLPLAVSIDKSSLNPPPPNLLAPQPPTDTSAATSSPAPFFPPVSQPVFPAAVASVATNNVAMPAPRDCFSPILPPPAPTSPPVPDEGGDAPLSPSAAGAGDTEEDAGDAGHDMAIASSPPEEPEEPEEVVPTEEELLAERRRKHQRARAPVATSPQLFQTSHQRVAHLNLASGVPSKRQKHEGGLLPEYSYHQHKLEQHFLVQQRRLLSELIEEHVNDPVDLAALVLPCLLESAGPVLTSPFQPLVWKLGLSLPEDGSTMSDWLSCQLWARSQPRNWPSSLQKVEAFDDGYAGWFTPSLPSSATNAGLVKPSTHVVGVAVRSDVQSMDRCGGLVFLAANPPSDDEDKSVHVEFWQRESSRLQAACRAANTNNSSGDGHVALLVLLPPVADVATACADGLDSDGVARQPPKDDCVEWTAVSELGLPYLMRSHISSWCVRSLRTIPQAVASLLPRPSSSAIELAHTLVQTPDMVASVVGLVPGLQWLARRGPAQPHTSSLPLAALLRHISDALLVALSASQPGLSLGSVLKVYDSALAFISLSVGQSAAVPARARVPELVNDPFYTDFHGEPGLGFAVQPQCLAALVKALHINTPAAVSDGWAVLSSLLSDLAGTLEAVCNQAIAFQTKVTRTAAPKSRPHIALDRYLALAQADLVSLLHAVAETERHVPWALVVARLIAALAAVLDEVNVHIFFATPAHALVGNSLLEYVKQKCQAALLEERGKPRPPPSLLASALVCSASDSPLLSPEAGCLSARVLGSEIKPVQLSFDASVTATSEAYVEHMDVTDDEEPEELFSRESEFWKRVAAAKHESDRDHDFLLRYLSAGDDSDSDGGRDTHRRGLPLSHFLKHSVQTISVDLSEDVAQEARLTRDTESYLQFLCRGSEKAHQEKSVCE